MRPMISYFCVCHKSISNTNPAASFDCPRLVLLSVSLIHSLHNLLQCMQNEQRKLKNCTKSQHVLSNTGEKLY